MRHLKAAVRRKSAAGLLTVSPVHEGHGTCIQRADGSVDEQEFRKAGAQVSIPIEAITGGTFEEMLERMEPVADQIAKAQSETLFKAIEEAAKSAGTATNAGGGPLTAELMLDQWEKMHIDFDSHGRPQIPTLVAGPSQRTQMEAEWGRLQSDPALRKRVEEVFARKKQEWVAREAERVLAG